MAVAHKPWALRLPPGKGADLKRDMEALVQDLHGAVTRAFESDEYRTRTQSVLILSGFLAGRYALDYPLSLSASLVFEQSYGGVEGDSASSAELYALLIADADNPLLDRRVLWQCLQALNCPALIVR